MPWYSKKATHYGYDLGARNLTLMVAEMLGATAIISNYSRLYLDYNRKTHDPSCFRPDMGGIPVPGNEGIDDAERQLRERIARRPVEEAIAAELEGETPRGKGIISIHSFSRVWEANYRTCEIGVMWRDDPRLPLPLMEALRKQDHFAVDENEPYSFVTGDWFTLDRHGLSINVPNAYIEVRNDLLSSEDATRKMAKTLAFGIERAFETLD